MSEYIISTTNMPEHVRETLNAWCDVSGEIVRCRDCKYYNPNDEPSEVYPDRYWCDLLTNYLKPDGFCAWGVKRKEGGDD